MSDNYSILKDEKSVYVTCIRPHADCSLFKTYRDLVNLKITKTVTRKGVLVYSFNLRGTDADIQDSMPTVYDLTRHICEQCQSTELRPAACKPENSKQR